MIRLLQILFLLLVLSSLSMAMVSLVSSSKHAERLGLLDPVDSQAYFELGEEIASVARTREDRDLAIRLFALADHLDPKRWRRSSILAIGLLVDDPNVHRLLESNLQAWSDSVDFLPFDAELSRQDEEIVLSAVMALSAFRQGDAKGFRRELAKEGVRDRLDVFQELPGNTEWMSQRLASGVAGPGSLSEEDIIALLEVQGRLLRMQHRPWSVVLQTRQGAPMTVVDPVSLAEIFGVDATQTRYRNGRWE
ncbi:MAG: hypothetical protein CMJ39_03780 [Phycisphaerae bacterium]|nr:hypothetical protein [Phycisphaerae bacterium]|tara:strand:- start:1160 stop:1909 length:750 start_codon:yes stop_codon:yes gene_type:complete